MRFDVDALDLLGQRLWSRRHDVEFGSLYVYIDQIDEVERQQKSWQTDGVDFGASTDCLTVVVFWVTNLKTNLAIFARNRSMDETAVLHSNVVVLQILSQPLKVSRLGFDSHQEIWKITLS